MPNILLSGEVKTRDQAKEVLKGAGYASQAFGAAISIWALLNFFSAMSGDSPFALIALFPLIVGIPFFLLGKNLKMAPEKAKEIKTIFILAIIFLVLAVISIFDNPGAGSIIGLFFCGVLAYTSFRGYQAKKVMMK